MVAWLEEIGFGNIGAGTGTDTARFAAWGKRVGLGYLLESVGEGESKATRVGIVVGFAERKSAPFGERIKESFGFRKVYLIFLVLSSCTPLPVGGVFFFSFFF